MKTFLTFTIGVILGLSLVIVAFNLFPEHQEKDTITYREDSTTSSVVTVALDQETLQERIYDSRRNAITKAIERVSPAVVGINVISVREVRYRSPFYDDPFFRSFFPDQVYRRRVENLGSGFIISTDGYILTNEHVVQNATQIVVTTTGGEKYDADIVGYDYESDVALLKINASGLPYIEFGDSDDLIIGEWSIALGNPFGLFTIHAQPTVTVGVLSAYNRDFERNQDGRLYLDMIQTDAAINRGNSGGPLVNSLGLLIGMNTMIFTETGGSIGLGFAIPSNKLKQIYDDLRERGQIDRNVWIGFQVQNVDRLIAISLRLPEISGVIVTEVEKDSPAAKSGLEVTDVIVSLNNNRINNFNDIQRILRNSDLRVGDVLKLGLISSGTSKEVNIVLEGRRN